MRLNVTNPSLWPAEVQDLHLEHDSEAPGGPNVDAYTMSSSDRPLALLERCHADEWAMIMEHGEEVRIPVSEAWELEVLDDAGRTVGHRMLIPTTPMPEASGVVDP